MRILITCLICLALAGTAVAAERTVTITPIEGPAQMTPLAAPAGVCVFGNQNPAAWAITDWIWGQESYATVFEAVQPDCGCVEGFTVEAVHFAMNFGIEDVPVTFDASASFLETTFDAAAGCDVPGAEICTSPTYTITIDTPGLYDISLPIDTVTCPCAHFGYNYAVTMNLLTAFTENPDAITDNFPVGCMSFNDYGSGWLDLIDFSFPGEVILNADIVCCAPAVPTEDKAWGDVKSLFR